MALRISVESLSQGSQGADVAEVHRALAELGRSIPAVERENRVYGAGTAAVIRAVQEVAGAGTGTGLVDPATVRVINGLLASVDTRLRTVRGTVRDVEGRPSGDGIVQVFDQRPGGEFLLGESALGVDGSYAIRYELAPERNGHVDIRVAVLAGGGVVESTPSGRSILTGAGELEVIDFVLDGADHAPSAEFGFLVEGLAPLLGARTLHELVEDDLHRDVSLLAAQSGHSPEQVGALVQAHKLADDTGRPAPVFYGLLRMGLPGDWAALNRVHPDDRVKALKAAVERGFVAPKIDGVQIEDFLTGFVPDPIEDLNELLDVTVDEGNDLVRRYVGHTEPAAFWKELANDPGWGSRATELRFTTQVGALTNKHTPLVEALKTSPDVEQASDLVRLSEDQWTSLVSRRGIGVPPETPGATDEEKVGNYVRRILTQVENAFPTAYFAERLGSSPVATFLKDQPAYELTSTYPEEFFDRNPAAERSLSPSDHQQLRTFQRLHHLTGSTSETLGLAAQGVESAQQITQMGRTVFAEQHKDVLSADRADQIYNKAEQTHAAALALYTAYAPNLNPVANGLMPSLDGGTAATLAAASVPDWQTLFGSFDLCSCQECASVHGPAAYLVDLLHFLDERNIRTPLFARRPDLGDIELSCHNSTTRVPVIDLVNELLENAVAAPPPFVPFVLAASLEVDLQQAVVTPALAGAFTPPVQPGARIETVLDATRWRISDALFTYSIVKEAGALNVGARSRQTIGSEAERRAAPQYRNDAAYTTLAETFYPWQLPFELAREDAHGTLSHLGVSRGDLIEVLRPTPDLFDPADLVVRLIAAERLGLSDNERRIIVGEPVAPPQLPSAFWGGRTTTELRTVRTLLDSAGLSYAELDALVATRFINPSGGLRIEAKAGAPLDTCDTTRLEIAGLTDPDLDRIHRFVRLWRRLGWTISETDRALHAVTPPGTAPALDNETLVRLDHLRALAAGLRLPIGRALPVWGSAGLSERQAMFARQLNLTVEELVIAIELTGLDPMQASTSQDAAVFVEIAGAVRGSGFSWRRLDYLLRHRVNAAAPFVPLESMLARTLTEIRSDLALVASEFAAEPDPPDPAVVAARRLDAVSGRLSAVLDLPVDVTRALLDDTAPAAPERVIKYQNESALQWLLKLTDITDEMLVRGRAAEQFATFEHLVKVADVIGTLRLSGSQVPWLLRENPWLTHAPRAQTDPISFAIWASLVQYPHARRELGAQDAALEALTATLIRVKTAPNTAAQLEAKKAFADAVAQWLSWRAADVEALIGRTDTATDLGMLEVELPKDYSIELLIRLNRAIKLLTRLGASAQTARQWCEAAIDDSHAQQIRDAAKAKVAESAWQETTIRLQDRLREAQRRALVSYLTAHPQSWSTGGRTDAAALSAHFLIDVEMSACQLTSRIKQAIGSTQLFTQRCLMGLEGVETTEQEWVQWSWMKSYRVWEANRKIWLYPENWIEPQLRDDKTPFFAELESELLQSEMTDASGERALRHYLQKVNEVARLEIVGVYEDDETDDLHVFGRTFHTPRVYYYRRRDGATHVWQPWHKVDLDIEGDHLIPVVWYGKLMVIWPLFAEKPYPKDAELPEPGNKLTPADKYWEIRLAWSEYEDDHWSGKYMSDPVSFEAYRGEDNVLFGKFIREPQRNVPFMRPLNGILDPHSLKAKDNQTTPGDPPPDPQPGEPNPAPPATSQPADRPRRLVSPELFSFKALGGGDSPFLTVRGFLRRDYRATPGPTDDEIACCFGEFRFDGCRKIVTTAHMGHITGWNYPLAPIGTKLDHMWFSGPGGALTLLDGAFPTYGKLPSFAVDANERRPITGDPSATTANRCDIPVFEHISAPVRILAPHQDFQFLGDRPFFVTDNARTFLGTSTGTSGRKQRPGGWLDADLTATWRADYFRGDTSAKPATPETSEVPDEGMAPFTVLVPDRLGRRVATPLSAVTLRPAVTARTLIPTFWTTREYQFANFHHPYLCDFVKAANRGGIPQLLSLTTQSTSNLQSFSDCRPKPRVLTPHPVDEVDFSSDGTYAIYNWELFFHIPFLIAEQLSKNQRFEEAQRWFHFIFDPTAATDNGPQRYWRTKPFHDRAKDGYEVEAVKTIETIVAEGLSPEWNTAIAMWRNNPFSPHAIARLRTTAYQKAVVLKYIDNLIAWGDQLFRRDTMETVNEAAQLYALASEILGPAPDVIDRNIKPAMRTFNTLTQIGLLGNTLEQVELLITDADGNTVGSPQTPPLPIPRALYFGVPENGKLLAYWGTIADRMFNIRHCRNIEGQQRQLALDEPPIDPALLVRARAAGLSVGEAISEAKQQQLPSYRFAVMLQKANELTENLRNLGGALLAAVEKRDAEALSALRSGQEVTLLKAVRDARNKQIDEADRSIEALEHSRYLVEQRKIYYESRETVNGLEALSLKLSAATAMPLVASAHLRILAGLLAKFGDTKVGSPTTAGVQIGPYYVGVSLEEAALAADVAGSVLSLGSQLTGRMGELGRRKDDWELQAQLAATELQQIDKQILAAEIRRSIAEQELSNHDRQIDNAREADDFLREKFSNQDLYQWMVGQVSGLYFQSYQLAYDVAKRAERCLQHELGLTGDDPAIIRFGSWDSLRKGLLAGDHLAQDLKRLEVAYLDRNKREFELVKHVSLLQLDPLALTKLKETGRCEFQLPEESFDLDYPGHYFRRIKSVSLTLPCVTGPYTTVACTLRLLNNSVRVATGDGATGNYPRDTDPNGVPAVDSRFVETVMPDKATAIAVSGGQNDSGVFELNFRDDRYLPFEGAGVISEWSLELFNDDQDQDFGRSLRQFDYDTISDAVLHVKYTAREDTAEFKHKAVEHLRDYFTADGAPSMLVLNLRRDFPSQWARFLTPDDPAEGNAFELDVSHDLFPVRDAGKTLKVHTIWLLARCGDDQPRQATLSPPLPASGATMQMTPTQDYGGLHFIEKDVSNVEIDPGAPPTRWVLGVKPPAPASQELGIDDVFVVLGYQWEG